MSAATNRKANTLNRAGVPPAPPEAHQKAGGKGHRNSGNASTEARTDVYTCVTDRIIAALQAGPGQVQRPWVTRGGSILPRRANGHVYKGVNVLLLWIEAAKRGYTSGTWMTYRQAALLGGQVRKGETGTLVVYANTYDKDTTNADGEASTRKIGFMKGYTVFNVDQIDRLPPAFYPAPLVLPEPFELIAKAEAFFRATRADIRAGGEAAFYSPELDYIQIPSAERFRDAEAHAAITAHELVHWSGHRSRLARDLSHRFGSAGYAAEELIAEMGAAFVCAVLGLSAEPRPDHAAYVANWLQLLRQDNRAIFTAASQAQRAADYLFNLTGIQSGSAVAASDANE